VNSDWLIENSMDFDEVDECLVLGVIIVIIILIGSDIVH